MVDRALGIFMQLAYASFKQHVSPDYTVRSAEVDWLSRPAPRFKFTVARREDESKRHDQDWTPLRIWISEHGPEWEIHVSDGRGKRVSTGRMTGPAPTVAVNPVPGEDRYGAALKAAAMLMASHVDREASTHLSKPQE